MASDRPFHRFTQEFSGGRDMAQNSERTGGSASGEAGRATRPGLRVASRPKSGWRENGWLLPVAALIVFLMIDNVPGFRSLDSARLHAPLNPAAPVLNYILIAAHVGFSVLCLITACLAIWHWLRVRHPALHRWSGRVYLFTALPAALVTLPITYLHTDLQNPIAGYSRGVFWIVSTLIAYSAIRRGDQVRHRRWMVYSFATATSVAWGQVYGLFLPAVPTPGQIDFLMEVALWGGPLVNLLVAKWWLDRTERREAAVRVLAERKRASVDRRAA
jgi:uncharacterized membrane protein